VKKALLVEVALFIYLAQPQNNIIVSEIGY